MLFRRRAGIEASRKKLLNVIAGAPNVTFIRSYGNIGDQLIYAGMRQLLSKISYVEASGENLEGVSGHTALVSGGGAWCQPYHEFLPTLLPLVEQRFERVVVLPSSFDVSVDCVREALENTKAMVFARELESYGQIRQLCKADIAYDCAFFFDFRPHKRRGNGVLIAYRSDKESALDQIPSNNNDISVTCSDLDEWLWAISRYEAVETDRAHVMIAAALLGKRVEYRASTYHKVPAIANFSLKGFPVRPKMSIG